MSKTMLAKSSASMASPERAAARVYRINDGNQASVRAERGIAFPIVLNGPKLTLRQRLADYRGSKKSEKYRIRVVHFATSLTRGA